MPDPAQLDPSSFLDFIARPTPAVVLFAVHPAHPWNERFGERLDQEGEDFAFARLPLMDLLQADPRLLAFLYQECRATGANVPFPVPPGYYLFQKGRMIEWDSGLPQMSDAERMIRASALGGAFALFADKPSLFFGAMRAAADDAAADRLAERFRRASQQERENPRTEARPPRPDSDELASAYTRLGVDRTATDEEINRAWRALRRNCHPDLAASDPAEFERRNRHSVELNRARDLIFAHRHAEREGQARAASA